MTTAAAEKVIKAYCSRMCTGICGILVTVKDGKIVRIEGDPDSPFNRGQICPKGAAIKEVIYHPDRLKYPLKSTGQKPSRMKERISWDEALTAIAAKFIEVKNKYGPESIAICTGSPKGFENALVQRFASVLGTPNVVTPGSICHMPRELAAAVTCGAPVYPDFEHPPALLVVWGSNTLQTHEMGVSRAHLKYLLEKKSKVMVIDPLGSTMTPYADFWLKPRPGSDGALALAMANVVIGENLYDREFVSRWTVGFEELTESVKKYSPEWAEKMTWVPAEQIRRAARLYAGTRPAAIHWGNALEHNMNSFQTCRAISILRAITGNLDVPGGEVFPDPAPVLRPADFMLLKKYPRNQQKALGSECKMAVRSMFSPTASLVKAILEEKPYPVKALWIFGSNPLLSFSDSRQTYEALNKVDFLVVSDLFMTPTAELADMVLPAAAALEFNDIGQYATRFGFVSARPKVVEPPGECRPDIRIINELAREMGMGNEFWDDVEQAFEVVLQPSGMTFEQFKKAGILKGGKSYRKYEGKNFSTPSGKVELFSQQLKDMGYDPLPDYIDLEEKVKQDAGKYPYILTSAKPASFYHSALHRVNSLRRISPEPVVQLNPGAAGKLGINEGDWINIETAKGSIQQKAKLSPEIDPRVVAVTFGWWYPEKGEATLYGWDVSNVNVLTDNSMPSSPQIGSTFLRGIRCNISKIN